MFMLTNESTHPHVKIIQQNKRLKNHKIRGEDGI